MGADKEHIINLLTVSVEKLQRDIDNHSCLLASVVEKRSDEKFLSLLTEVCPKRAREVRLEKIIREAINELEESRKSFKSKRLEALRKRLTDVLIEDGR